MFVTLVGGPMMTGGIETLLTRVANELAGRGTRVQMLCEDGPLIERFSAKVEVACFRTWDEAATFFGPAARPGERRSVFSFDPTSCALASWLVGRSNERDITHASGVYHPAAWFLENDPLRLAINRMLLRTLADEQIFFMSPQVLGPHAIWVRRPFARSPLLPLGVQVHPPRSWSAASEIVRIATVGRLVHFKEFVRFIPGIARALIDRGLRIEWKIFGTGELEAPVREEIARTATGGIVSLEGHLPYPQFGATLSTFDIFVGMGTSAVEAATIGLPTIIATPGANDRSYGLLQDLPFGNPGDMMDQPPVRTIEELLIELLAGGHEARARAGTESRQAALRYSMEDYASGLLAIGERATPKSRLVTRAVGWLYGQATVGRTRRAVQAVRRPFRK